LIVGIVGSNRFGNSNYLYNPDYFSLDYYQHVETR